MKRYDQVMSIECRVNRKSKDIRRKLLTENSKGNIESLSRGVQINAIPPIGFTTLKDHK